MSSGMRSMSERTEPHPEGHQPTDVTPGSRIQDWFKGPARASHWIAVGMFGMVLYFPFLGTSGLWDCWEPHYAEVAREMVERGNWLEPTWEVSSGESTQRKHFFSKPVLSIWLMAIPMKLFGVHDPQGGIAPGLEWLLRIPFALLAIVGSRSAFRRH